MSGIQRAYTENINPLAQGETADYKGVVDSQFAQGMQKAAALFGDMSVFA